MERIIFKRARISFPVPSALPMAVSSDISLACSSRKGQSSSRMFSITILILEFSENFQMFCIKFPQFVQDRIIIIKTEISKIKTGYKERKIKGQNSIDFLAIYICLWHL